MISVLLDFDQNSICLSNRQYVETKAMPELYELVNRYNPDVLWADSGDALGTGSYIGSQNFLAWLYNESPVKDIVAINDRYSHVFL